ncbi:MAG: dUTP diphosphatase [Clostridia bacterium]|nr:dUTP diphosphatase [Clostridia bacterium]
MKIRIKPLSDLLGKNVPLPEYVTRGAAGMDACACITDCITINPKERVAVPLGFAMEVPRGYAAFIYARSGLGLKKGITLPNCVGVIDSDYRGEVKCALTNISEDAFIVNPGDRICQIVISAVISAELEITDTLSDTLRDAGGFGSTGIGKNA